MEKLKKKGAVKVPKGLCLNQVIAMFGVQEMLSRKVEFLRFNFTSDPGRRKFTYNQLSRVNSYSNPILINGDIINITNSLLGKASELSGKFHHHLFKASLFITFFQIKLPSKNNVK